MKRDDVLLVLERCGPEFTPTAEALRAALQQYETAVTTSVRLVPTNELLDIYRGRYEFAKARGMPDSDLAALVRLFESNVGSQWRLICIDGKDCDGGVFMDASGSVVGCVRALALPPSSDGIP